MHAYGSQTDDTITSRSKQLRPVHIMRGLWLRPRPACLPACFVCVCVHISAHPRHLATAVAFATLSNLSPLPRAMATARAPASTWLTLGVHPLTTMTWAMASMQAPGTEAALA